MDFTLQQRYGRVCLEYRRSLQEISILPCLVIKANGKPQRPSPDRTVNGPDPLGIKLWATLPAKEPQPAEVIPEGRRNIKTAVAEGNYKYQLYPLGQYKNKDCNYHEYFLILL